MEHHLTRDCPNAESTCPLVGQCDFQVRQSSIHKIENDTLGCAEIPDLFRVLNMISHKRTQRT